MIMKVVYNKILKRMNMATGRLIGKTFGLPIGFPANWVSWSPNTESIFQNLD